MKLIGTLVLVVMFWLSAAFATTPNLVHYQGSLGDGSGNPAADSTYSVTFSIYAATSGGTALWSEVQSVSTESGLFSVLLGSVTPFDPDLFDDSSRYLATTIDGTELSPRSRLASAPYGFVARRIRGDIESGENSLAIGGSAPTDTAVLLDTSGIHLLGSALFSDSGPASRALAGAGAVAVKGVEIKNGKFTSRSQDGGTISIDGNSMEYRFVHQSPHKELGIMPGSIVVFEPASSDSAVSINVEGIKLHGTGGGSVHLSSDSIKVTSGGAGSGKVLVSNFSHSLELEPAFIKFNSSSGSPKITESIGDLRILSTRYTIGPGTVDFPDLKLSITDADAGTWHSWAEKFIIGDGGTVFCSSTVNLTAQLAVDFDRNGTANLLTSSAPATITFAPDTRLECEGPARFRLPVMIESDLMVTGGLTVVGPKAFAHDHPTDPDLQVIYVALEGNEAGTYTRGSAQLQNGKTEILLPEDFAMVTGEDRLTAQITPRGPVQGMLYVESVSPTGLVVRASNQADQDSRFDFFVNGVRKGFEAHRVIQARKVAMRP